jgi:predicted outer membrane repeat protein
MRRIVLCVTVALVATMFVASAVPTLAKQAKTGVEGQAVGAGTCTVAPGTPYPTIQSAVDDTNCQTIQLSVGDYVESVTIDRDVTIVGSTEHPTVVHGAPGLPVFDIGSGATVVLKDLQIMGGSGHPNGQEPQGGGIYNAGTLTLIGVRVHDNKAVDGGGIYNAGTLTLDTHSSVDTNTAFDGGGIYNAGTLTLSGQSSVHGNTATNKGGGIYNAGTLVLNDAEVYANKALDGGGIYNAGTLRLNAGSSVHDNVATHDGGGIYNDGALYLCGGTVSSNHLTTPTGPENNVSGTPAQDCPPSSPGPGGPPGEGNRVLVEHKGQELCLPEAALKGHLKHGDEVIDEQGCSDTDQGSRRGLK